MLKMALRNLNSIVPESAYCQIYESHSFGSQKVVVSIDSTAINPLDIVKKYMLDEIKAIRETRHMLKNQYPELFSSYDC